MGDSAAEVSVEVAREDAGRVRLRKMKEKDLLCPRCKVVMKKLKKKEVVLDICGKCGGMWLDYGEMNKLMQMNNEVNK